MISLVSAVRLLSACLATTSLCIPTLALAEDFYVDPGELTQTTTPSFSDYAECPHTYALSGALLALNTAPKVGRALSQAPKPTSPQTAAVALVVVGVAVISSSGDETPLIDPGTEVEREDRRLGLAWEFERSREEEDLRTSLYAGDPLPERSDRPLFIATDNPYIYGTELYWEWERLYGQERWVGGKSEPCERSRSVLVVCATSDGGDGAVTKTAKTDPTVEVDDPVDDLEPERPTAVSLRLDIARLRYGAGWSNWQIAINLTQPLHGGPMTLAEHDRVDRLAELIRSGGVEELYDELSDQERARTLLLANNYADHE